MNVGIRSRMVWAVNDNEFIIRLNEIILDVLDNYNYIPQVNINNFTPNEVNLNQIIQN